MHTEHFTKAVTIVGLELRTSNLEANQTIPAHWNRFATEAVLERITHKASSDVYAVYTRYQHEGLNNTGVYSLVIGAAVSSLESLPADLTSVVLPASIYEVVAVPHGRPELVGEAWQTIWQQDTSTRTFIADCERYRSDGAIDILLGVSP